jgi:hypothetical protein
MKVVNTEGGRILELVALEELRPVGGVYVPDFLRAITARYSFVQPPTNFEEMLKSGMKFEGGKFTLADNTVVSIKELSLHNDGIICEAFNTQIADLVLDDFVAWAIAEFKLHQPLSAPRRTYTSSIICDFEKDVEPGLGKIARLSSLLSKALGDAYGWKYKYELFRLGLNVDPRTIPQYRLTNFIFERRTGIEYSKNRFFSIAPLTTEAHIHLLEVFEAELSAN